MGKRQTTAARDQRRAQARAAREKEQTRKVLRTKPKGAVDLELVDAPRGYVFTVLSRGRAHLMEIGKVSTLCAVRSSDMRFAPRRDGDARECSTCRKVWAKRERYGHPAELEENAQAFDEVIAQRVANAAASGG
jgi:hypothetical protein